MTINTQQLEAYRQALEAWKSAAREAQKLKERVYSAANTAERMYIMTDQDLHLLNKECDLYRRLEAVARTL